MHQCLCGLHGKELTPFNLVNNIYLAKAWRNTIFFRTRRHSSTRSVSTLKSVITFQSSIVSICGTALWLLALKEFKLHSEDLNFSSIKNELFSYSVWAIPENLVITLELINLPPLSFNLYHYYSFKTFLRFWLAKSTRKIPHKELLLNKFERNFLILNRWRQKCSQSCRLLNR